MLKFDQVNFASIHTLEEKIEEKVKQAICLEDAAQKFTDLLYEELKPSIVLVRLFVAVPFGELPVLNQKIVLDLGTSAGVSSLINDQTLVLSLLGTRGTQATWNSRHNSQQHIGIPLVSGKFIDTIPMMSRLLKELGLGLDWIDSQDTKIVTRKLGSINGVFYVPDAKTATDKKGRKIISAQDFVSLHKVKTVFGLGGGYLINNFFATSIVFTSETLDKSTVELFSPVMSRFQSDTMALVGNHKIFAQ